MLADVTSVDDCARMIEETVAFLVGAGRRVLLDAEHFFDGYRFDPAYAVKALKAAPQAWDKWRALSFTHQREHVEAIEGAKKPETRVRRIEAAVRMLVK